MITAQAVKAKFLGTDATSKTLKDIINYHNKTMIEVLKPGTLKNYGATGKYLLAYLSNPHKSSNIFLKNITYQFITGFDSYLRRVKDKNGKKQLSSNGVKKHLERFKKLTNLAIKVGWMEENPFWDNKMKRQQ